MHSSKLAVAVIVALFFPLWLVPAGAGTQRRGALPPAPSWTFLNEKPTGPFDLVGEISVLGSGEARICFGYQDGTNYYCVQFAKQGASLLRVVAGSAKMLSPVRLIAKVPTSQVLPVTIKRRGDVIEVVCGDRAVLKGRAVLKDGCLAGIACTGGAAGKLLRVQPVGPPDFSDDFMRQSNTPNPWEPLSGQWDVSAIISNADRSRNGFLYQGSGSPGLSAVGYSFWENYVIHASLMCPDENGDMGVAAYCRDHDNYLALSWSSREGLRLLRVRSGVRSVLSQKQMPWVPRQWYRLSLQVEHGNVTAMIDGAVCLEARDTSFDGGKAALYVNGKSAYFDDVAVEPAIYFHVSAMPAGGGSDRVRVFGGPSWCRYVIRTTIVPANRDGIDLVFGRRDARNYSLLRWHPQDGSASAACGREIVRMVDGHPKTVAEGPGGYVLGRTYHVAISVRPAYAAVGVDNERVLEVADECLTGGAVALQPDPNIQDLEVWLNSEAQSGSGVGWQWQLGSTPVGPVSWGNKVCWGDIVVRLPAMALPNKARLAVLLAPRWEDPRGGYIFEMSRISPVKARLRLVRDGVAARERIVPVGNTIRLDIARRGTCLAATLNGRTVMALRQAELWCGTYVGLQASGMGSLEKGTTVHFDSAIRGHSALHEVPGAWYRYPFREAPVDWAPQSGTWSITSRWTCDPRPSYFGGWGDRAAVLWNKRRLGGDLTLRFVTAPKMLKPQLEAEPERFRDLNATICADSDRLSTGYSFIIGGWSNTKCAILKRGRVVAESAAYRFPIQTIGHNRWFMVRIEKRGSRLSLRVDDTPVLTYEDPDPLTGDRVALWTQNNGMMVGWVDIACERETDAPLVLRPSQASPDAVEATAVVPTRAPLVNSFEDGLAQWSGTSARLSTDETTASRGNRSLLLENRGAGGDFRAVAFKGSMDTVEVPHIDFDYRITPDVRVNLYVLVRRTCYPICFTGSDEKSAESGRGPEGEDVETPLGSIQDVVADGAWHHATFDLLTALRRRFPDASAPKVKEILFANLDQSDPYLCAGATGNSLGSRYWIDQFCLGPYSR